MNCAAAIEAATARLVAEAGVKTVDKLVDEFGIRQQMSMVNELTCHPKIRFC